MEIWIASNQINNTVKKDFSQVRIRSTAYEEVISGFRFQKATVTKRTKVSPKLWRYLCTLRWLKLTLKRVSNSKPGGSITPYTGNEEEISWTKKWFTKYWIEFVLFIHTVRKNVLLKQLVWHTKRVSSLLRWLFREATRTVKYSFKYEGTLPWKILNNNTSLRCNSLCQWLSRPSSW